MESEEGAREIGIPKGSEKVGEGLLAPIDACRAGGAQLREAQQRQRGRRSSRGEQQQSLALLQESVPARPARGGQRRNEPEQQDTYSAGLTQKAGPG
jgi:hypothetical protein